MYIHAYDISKKKPEPNYFTIELVMLSLKYKSQKLLYFFIHQFTIYLFFNFVLYVWCVQNHVQTENNQTHREDGLYITRFISKIIKRKLIFNASNCANFVFCRGWIGVRSGVWELFD